MFENCQFFITGLGVNSSKDKVLSKMIQNQIFPITTFTDSDIIKDINSRLSGKDEVEVLLISISYLNKNLA